MPTFAMGFHASGFAIAVRIETLASRVDDAHRLGSAIENAAKRASST